LPPFSAAAGACKSLSGAGMRFSACTYTS
jgi:hypothetical protein